MNLKSNCAPVPGIVRGLIASIVVAILGSTANVASAEEPLRLRDSQLEPINWTDLVGWTADDHLAAFVTFQKSCQALRKLRTDDHRPIYGALWNTCRKAIRAPRSIPISGTARLAPELQGPLF
jgi:hypothetical protein